MEYYLPIKHLHITCVVLSLSLFCVRAFWSIRGSDLLQQKWVKIAPHIVDTLLLSFGIALMVIADWPVSSPWLVAKWIGLIFYIGLGTFAIKRGKTALLRFGFSLAAVTVFAYIVGCAISKQPLSWLAFL